MEKEYAKNNMELGNKGLQNDPVSDYLRSRKEQTVEKMKREIRSHKEEINNLKHEIAILKKVRNNPENFADFALDRGSKTGAALAGIANPEFAKVYEERERIVQKHEEKMLDLEEKIRSGKEYAYGILNNILERINNVETAAQEAEKESPAPEPEKQQVSEPEKQQVPEPATAEKKAAEDFWEEKSEPEKTEKNVPDKTEETKSDPKDKYAYVVGKVAGEDLMDKSGKLIIAKGETITGEVVEKAEKEGKLIELVVGMKLQEDE